MSSDLKCSENINYFRLMSDKRDYTRFIEVSTGLLLILSVISLLFAFLMNFDYTSPNASFEEDLDFLNENLLSQKLSALLWIIAGSIILLFLPFYLLLFQRFQKGMHIFNSLLILATAYTFFKLGITGMHIYKVSEQYVNEILQEAPMLADSYLISIRQSVLLLKIGLTSFGAFATVFTISRFSEVKFPVIGSALTFLAAPVVITFTWLNQDHILMTSALAVFWIGLLIIGSRLVNKGLKVKNPLP